MGEFDSMEEKKKRIEKKHIKTKSEKKIVKFTHNFKIFFLFSYFFPIKHIFNS